MGGKPLRCAPANSPITRGRGVRKPIDRLLRPLALGAWTYATGSPTPKGLGSCSERPAALTCLSGFRHPRTVRIRSTSIIGHTQCLWQFAIHGRRLLPRCDCSAFFASHHSGLFLPQRDPENSCALTRTHAEDKPPKDGSAPSRPQGVSPGFRAPLVQPFAPSAPASPALQGWVIPLSLQLLPPAFARWRSACRYMPRMA